MTFNDIVLKMFKSNFRRYLLFFLCSTFTITIFFMYSTLFTNTQFMKGHGIYSSISSNTIASSFIVGIFSVFFIIYAQSSFNKFRKPEFGLLMVLGCTNKDIRKIILLENSLIALISLVFGLSAGTLLSNLFFLIIIKITGITGISFTINLNSYLYTILLFVIIYVVVIAAAMINTLRFEILDLIKELRRGNNGVVFKPSFLAAGIILIIFSVIDMLINFTINNSSMILRSASICFIGTYLVISNIGWINEKICDISKKQYYKNMLFNSNIKNTFVNTKKLLLICSWLVCIAIFFFAFVMTLLSDSKNMVVAKDPYHIAYTKQFKYNDAPNGIVDNIIKKGRTQLITHKELNFVQQDLFIFFSENDLNKLFHCNFKVKRGHFISLNQIVKNDGYIHQINDTKEININLKNYPMNLITQGKCIKVIFNPDAIDNQYKLIVLNRYDYISLSKGTNKILLGSIRLFNFRDWKQTEGIVNSLHAVLKKYCYEGLDGFEISSRIKDYKSNLQSLSFAIFLLSFVAALFFLATNVMLHFKLLTEFEREKLKYKKIYKIGITKNEVAAVVKKELRIIFFLPIFVGLSLAVFYTYMTFNTANKGSNAAIFTIFVGLVYIGLQTAIYNIYKICYVNKITRL